MTQPGPNPAPTDWRANLVSPVALACFLLVAVVGLSLDLWTKSLAWEHLVDSIEPAGDSLIVTRKNVSPPGEAPRFDVVVWPNVLELTAVANRGAAMGLGQGLVSLFLIVSIAAAGVLFYFFLNSGQRRLYQVVLGLLLAGVLGNLYDRMVYGYVRDMIHIFPGVQWADLWSAMPATEVFPWVFNLADVYLCIGVPAVLLYGVFVTPTEAEYAQQPGDTSTAADAT